MVEETLAQLFTPDTRETQVVVNAVRLMQGRAAQFGAEHPYFLAPGAGGDGR